MRADAIKVKAVIADLYEDADFDRSWFN